MGKKKPINFHNQPGALDYRKHQIESDKAERFLEKHPGTSKTNPHIKKPRGVVNRPDVEYVNHQWVGKKSHRFGDRSFYESPRLQPKGTYGDQQLPDVKEVDPAMEAEYGRAHAAESNYLRIQSNMAMARPRIDKRKKQMRSKPRGTGRAGKRKNPKKMTGPAKPRK